MFAVFLVLLVPFLLTSLLRIRTWEDGKILLLVPFIMAYFSDTGAYCTEMEGAAIAHAAWRNQIPFVIIRAISDKADDSAQMDYPTFEAIAAERCARVTQKLAGKLAE